MQIYFLRHGRSRADDEERHEGRYDSPLTDVGRRQARARGLEWKEAGLKFTKIIASPLVRAEETAQIIGNTLGVDVETDPDWMEIDNGQLAGLTYGEAKERFPEPKFSHPFMRVAGGTGESMWQLQSRAMRALEKVMQLDKDGIYLIVSHGGTLNTTLRAILGAHPPVNGHGVYFGFGDLGYAKFEYRADRHQWVLGGFDSGE